LQYDERTAEDEQIPVVITKRGSYTLLLPLIGERKHLNTGIKKNNEEAKEDNPEETKIMFCLYGGVQTKIPFGTPYCYDCAGAAWGYISLQYAGAEGLFARFWKRYDALLRHAFRKVTCKLQMPLADFLKFNIFTPKLLNGMPVLPVNMKYSISRKGLEISEIEFRTLRLQLPYNLDAEQEIPQFSPSQYYWVRKDNIDQIISIYNVDPSDPLGYLKHEIITYPPSITSFEPPTEQQFIAGETVQVGKYQMRVCVEYRDGWGSVQAHWYDEEYTVWLEPRKK
jgi:hypothetical protein